MASENIVIFKHLDGWIYLNITCIENILQQDGFQYLSIRNYLYSTLLIQALLIEYHKGIEVSEHLPSWWLKFNVHVNSSCKIVMYPFIKLT